MLSKGWMVVQAHAERFRACKKFSQMLEEGSCQGMTGGPHLIKMLQELHELDGKDL